MGVHLKTTSFKFSDATLAKLDKLQCRFALVAVNRTQVCRLAIDVLELVAFTPATMDAVIRGIQGICGVAAYPLQSEFQFPAAVQQGSAGSDCSGGDLAARPRVVVAINHRRSSHVAQGVLLEELEAFGSSPFLASLRHPFAQLSRGVAA